MNCPHCGSNFFDGEYCRKCTRVTYHKLNGIKNRIKKNCEICGEKYDIYDWYGAVGRPSNAKEHYLCPDCLPKYYSREHISYIEEYSMGNSRNPKRLKQLRNFEEWCKGKKVAA